MRAGILASQQCGGVRVGVAGPEAGAASEVDGVADPGQGHLLAVGGEGVGRRPGPYRMSMGNREPSSRLLPEIRTYRAPANAAFAFPAI